MKKAILTCFLLILCTICFAEASGWFSPYPAGFNVNLEDSETYTGAAESIGLDGTGDAKRWNVSGYNDLTLIGLVGATGLGESTVTVTIEMEVKRIGDTLCYYSASEPELKRPFYIDLVACNSANDGKRKVTRIGYNDKDQSFSGSVTLTPYNGEAWADIVLCLPDEEGVDLSYALSADDYYCGLTIEMTGAVEKTWSYTFNGYIQDAPLTNKAQVFFIVDPEPEASAMSLQELLSDDRKPVQIGTYSFETQAFMTEGQTAGGDESLKYGRQVNNMYSIFASSSPDPFYGNETFSMKYEGDSSISFPFEIVIGRDPNNPEFSRRYDGSNELPLPNEESSGTATDFLLDSKKFDEALGPNHKGRSLYFRDNGSIWLEVPDSYKITEEELHSKFPAGTYSSTVYFHVVSDY